MATKIKAAARRAALQAQLASEAADDPDNPRERIGGNNPPPDVHIPTPEEITPALKAKLAPTMKEIAALGRRCVALTKEILTEAQQAAAQDAYKDFGEALKSWNALRVDEKEPYLAGSRAVDSFFLPVKERGAEVMGALNGELGKFLQRKEAAIRAKREAEARRAREEQAKRDREAEAARRREAEERAKVEALERENKAKEAAAARRALDAAQEKRDFAEAVADGAGVHVRAAEARADASPSSIARTRGDSSLGTLRREYDFVIEDVAKVPLEALRDFFKIEDIEKAVRAMVRVHGDKRTLPGVRIFEDTKANIR